MPDYIQDPNDSKKQIPGPLPDNYYDNIITPPSCSFTKTPNYVLISADLTNTAGFYFGNQTSFDALTSPSASSHYQNWGGEATLKAGTRLDIHPTAYTSSVADDKKIVFIYKGGLDGSGRY